MKSRNQVIAARSHGIRYFDRAAALVGREKIIETTIEILTRFKNGFGWGLGNAVIKILNPKGDISQSYNSDEVLTEEEIQRIYEECQMGNPHAIAYNCGFDTQEAPDCICYPRNPEKPGEDRFTDEQVIQCCLNAIATTQAGTTAGVEPSGQSFPTEKENSTGACKKLLAAAYQGMPAATAKWKRTGKKTVGDATIRTFSCNIAGTTETATVTITPTGSFVEKQFDPADIPARLITAARVIKHSGDYGELYWNPTTQTVWWTMSDSDDGSDFIEDTLRIPGVKQVITGCECGPDDEDETPGQWVFLGAHGEIHEDTFPPEFMAKVQAIQNRPDTNDQIPPDINKRQFDDFD